MIALPNPMTERLILLATGGTGGHVFPAEAVAVELHKRGFALALVTDRRGGDIGGRLAEFPIYRIQAGGIAGKGFVDRVVASGALGVGTLQAWQLLKRLSPAAVVGFGGYASVPTMMAASLCGVPSAIHEQNAVLGRANRLLAGRVGRIATSYEKVEAISTDMMSRVTRTGMPVRPDITALRAVPYLPPDREGPINLFVMGGSQGASIFSHVVPAALAKLDPSLRARMRVVQQCRPEDLDRIREAYAGLEVAADLASFFDNAPRHMADAHLVISRAGASSVAELTVIGRPAILVPYPHAIDDHQTINAHAVDESGAGWLMPDGAFTAAALADRLDALFALPKTLDKAAQGARAVGLPDAAERLADVVIDLVSANGGSDGEPELRREAA